MIAARTRQHDAGFTLVELIVASTLMTLVLSGVYFTFSTVVRSWRDAEAGTEAYQEGRRALGLLERELRGVPESALHLFQGRYDEVSFVTLSSPLDVELGEGRRLLFVRYYLDTDRGVTYLVRDEAPLVGPLPANRPRSEDLSPLRLGRRSEFTLATGVDRFELEYAWRIRRPPPHPSLPPPPARVVSDGKADRVLPEAVRVDLLLRPLDDLSGGPIPFSTTIAFRGATSRPPRYLVERNSQ